MAHNLKESLETKVRDFGKSLTNKELYAEAFIPGLFFRNSVSYIKKSEANEAKEIREFFIGRGKLQEASLYVLIAIPEISLDIIRVYTAYNIYNLLQ